MQLYNLNPELLREHLMELMYNPGKADLMAKVETKVKASMTRLYN